MAYDYEIVVTLTSIVTLDPPEKVTATRIEYVFPATNGAPRGLVLTEAEPTVDPPGGTGLAGTTGVLL
jgi:hypothetical protein